MIRALKKTILLWAVLISVALVIFFLPITSKLINQAQAASASNKEMTVVIDAGHGGADGGAISLSGAKESTINLDIAQRLELILAFYGKQVVMTRNSEDLDYSKNSDTIRKKKAEDQNRRLELIHSVQNAVLISIHQNIYPDSGPSGAQVLYAPTSGSKEFAVLMQQRLVDSLDSQNRRTAAQIPVSILLMNNITCPAVLVECGFLSNYNEEKLLLSDSYRLKVAAVIAASYLGNENSLTNTNTGGTNEDKNSIFLHRVR